VCDFLVGEESKPKTKNAVAPSNEKELNLNKKNKQINHPFCKKKWQVHIPKN
jgi:hypothetical protein